MAEGTTQDLQLDRSYDAFFITDNKNKEDVTFVDDLVDALEQQHGLRCLFAYRDYLGRPWTQNLAWCLDNSRKIVLVLSESFLRSPRCNNDMEQAFEERIARKEDILIGLQFGAITLSGRRPSMCTIDVNQPRYMDDLHKFIKSDSEPFNAKVVNSSLNVRLMKQPCSGIKITDVLTSEEYLTKSIELNYLLQSGSWAELEVRKNQFFKSTYKRQYTSPDIQFDEILYYVIAECLERNFHKAETLTEKALHILPEVENQTLMLARLDYMYAYRYLKEGNLEKAEKYLKQSLGHFEHMEPCFFHGVTLIHMAYVRAITPSNAEEIIRNNEKALGLLSRTDKRISANLRQRGMAKNASIMLNAESSHTRQMPLPDARNKLRRSGNIIERIQSLEDIPNRPKYAEFHLYMVEAYWQYRAGQIETEWIAKNHYKHGYSLATKAHNIASQCGFVTEFDDTESLLHDFAILLEQHSS